LGGKDRYENDIPAEEGFRRARTRFPRQNEHEERQKSPFGKTRQGKKEDRLIHF